MTGYSEEQTINPSELSLWRVIRINEDESLDIISENVSSTDIYFSGEVGYKNYVGYLNILAKQYENDKYTKGSRYIGYNGQTEFITVPINDTYSGTVATTSEPGKKSETEAYGGGDTLYNIDTDLVENVYGTLSANKVSSDVAAKYFLASRKHNYFGSNCQSWEVMNVYEKVTTGPLYSISLGCGGKDGGWDYSAALRPILTLKGDISPISGDGKTLSTAWTFE